MIAERSRAGSQRPPVMSARRRLHPEARREELTDAAIGVLRKIGPEHCRVEDITDAAGTAKGNFYRYFASWEDLLLAVRDRILASYGDELARRYVHDPTDWWAALDDEIERFVDFQLALGGLHQAIFHGPASVGREIRVGPSATSMVALFLVAGIDAGAFAPLDVEATAPLLFDVLHGAADSIAVGMDRERVLAAVRQIVHRTLDSIG
jgi:AcrR family transcriptional regulator